MSTTLLRTRALYALVSAGVAGCGWHFGAGPPVALSAGQVEGATVEPGLQAALSEGLHRAVRRRGLPSGPAIDLRIVSMEHAPEAALAGVEGGTVAWVAVLAVHAEVLDRPGCAVDLDGRRTWAPTSDEPLAAVSARTVAVAALADEVADRAVDLLLGRPECR